jgi:predicted HicB family RNase H-like nuclease
LPLNRKLFEAQIRFVLDPRLKARLFHEAACRGVSAADLIRAAIEHELERSAGTATRDKRDAVLTGRG